MAETGTAQVIEKRVVLDLDRCIECKSCMAACFYGHEEMAGVQFVDIGPALLPVVCRQCADPACVEVCPAEAMIRNERGVVARGIFRCRGCGSCVRACPFGVLSLEMVGHQVAKCDLCQDRIERGLEPRCVAVCPTGALRFATTEEIEAEGLTVLGGRVAGDHPIRRR
ncbi:MAG TPA: 4Fe-4S dicluster domain-containing protein [Phycisphaerae bacterium]|nr:4Fe-4S dicluster domain-containing protein [Phycisphaerae bacterium]HUX15418.1 4Fe-4S dicluster domain-containing protein [Phycisphaerae bacterium]